MLSQGHNSDFGNIKDIYSHRSEIFAVLSVLPLLDTYTMYYSLHITNTIIYYGDNLKVVRKLDFISNNPNEFDSLLKTMDHDAVILLNHYIYPQMTFHHVHIRQD